MNRSHRSIPFTLAALIALWPILTCSCASAMMTAARNAAPGEAPACCEAMHKSANAAHAGKPMPGRCDCPHHYAKFFSASATSVQTTHINVDFDLPRVEAILPIASLDRIAHQFHLGGAPPPSANSLISLACQLTL